MRQARGNSAAGRWGATIAMAIAAAACAQSPIRTWEMPAGDAVVRFTDSCDCTTLDSTRVLPDLTQLSIIAWQPTSPSTDVFTGSPVQCAATGCPIHFVRVSLKFKGLVNPPGTLGIGSGTEYHPFEFGPSPVYGFIDFDVDGDINTGGDSQNVAPTRFLGNAARFGAKPARNGNRAAVTGDDLLNPWFIDPQCSRSGADFSLVLCGCFPVTVVSKSNPSSTSFGRGETWVVQGRFFQRVSGYKPASGAFGGSAIGNYDPISKLRFEHNIGEDTTTVTLVFQLDQIAAQMTMNLSFTPAVNNDVSDANSVEEAIAELIGRSQQPGNLPAHTRALIEGWANKTYVSVRNPTEWKPTAIVGTAASYQSPSPYVWTDIGFDVVRGDVDGDGVVGQSDRLAIQNAIIALDGVPEFDAGPAQDGRVDIPDFGRNFSLYDRNGDGVIDALDLDSPMTQSCVADFDRDGNVTIDDIFQYLNAWFARDPRADVDIYPTLNVDDIFVFLNIWFTGC